MSQTKEMVDIVDVLEQAKSQKIKELKKKQQTAGGSPEEGRLGLSEGEAGLGKYKC